MKGLMILADYFEDSEALVTRDVLLRGGDFVITASVSDELEVTSQSGLVVQAVTTLKNIDATMYDYLVIPGGRAVKEILMNDKNVSKIILEFANQGKLIASICAAPSLLGRLGLLKGHRYTCFPGYESDSFEGIYLKDHGVVKDGNLIFARSMYFSSEFALEILKTHIESRKLENVLNAMKGL